MSQELIDVVFDSAETLNLKAKRLYGISSSMIDIGMEEIGGELFDIAEDIGKCADTTSSGLAKYINSKTGGGW